MAVSRSPVATGGFDRLTPQTKFQATELKYETL